jgi:hypothetical protein
MIPNALLRIGGKSARLSVSVALGIQLNQTRVAFDTL